MAQFAKGVDAPSKNMTAAEMQNWYELNKDKIQNFANASGALKLLRDVSKISTRTIPAFNKDDVVIYLQNANANELRLRNLAWYLFYRSQIFQRIVMYFASLPDLDAKVVIPPYNIIGNNNDTKILKSYSDTLNMISNWNIVNEFLKVWVTCLTQDVSYNVAYYDETGLYLLPMPADRCRLRAQYPTGDFSFALDMTYFNSTTNKLLIEAWGEPFTTMWQEYEADKVNHRWVVVPDEYCACFKYRSYDWQTILSPFSGLFLPLINLEDIADVQAVADAQEIYKLIYLELETITGSKVPDDWKIDPAVVVEYFNRMIDEALPSYTSAAIVPGKLNVVDFSSNDKTKETNKVLKATETVLNTSGGAQILNSATITGTTAFSAAIKSDTEFSICTLLPQVEGWINRIMPNVVTDPSYIKFFHCGRLTREDFRKELLENAQYGLPTKTAIMTLSGIDELRTLSLNHLEENILHLSDRFDSPLSSSFTTAKSEVGRPTSDDGDLTDDGEASREKVDHRG